ncbi:hypothetical protein NQZ68_009903 [Dissostichus eleginoides]|nr:hypothetical protein NQZ68_009903 [Dissostichus eleginoides]
MDSEYHDWMIDWRLGRRSCANKRHGSRSAPGGVQRVSAINPRGQTEQNQQVHFTET